MYVGDVLAINTNKYGVEAQLLVQGNRQSRKSLCLRRTRTSRMSLLITAGTIALLFLLIYKYIILPSFLSPLSKIPNAHFTSSVLSIWIWWKRRTGFETRFIYSAHQKQGPIIRLGPNEVSVASIDGLRQVYTGGFEKDKWYVDEFENYKTPNLVSMLQHKPHSIRKRMISNVYSKSYLHNSPDLHILSSTLLYTRLLPVLHSVAQAVTPINVLELFQACGMDFTSAYLFGITNGTNFISDIRARRQYFHNYLVKSRRLPGAGLATQEIEAFCLSMCNAASAFPSNTFPTPSPPMTNPIVYTQLLTSLLNPSSPTPRVQTIIASELLDHLIAGHETTGITLTYLLYSLSQRPALQSLLRSELLTLSPPLRYPAPCSEAVDDQEQSLVPDTKALDTLPLLNAIAYETLRLYAAAPAPQPRISPPRPTVIDGYTIPTGTRVSTAAYVMHRNTAVYPEPEVWRPERWLGEKGEEMRWFWAFGSGGRMCVGSHFALLGMYCRFFGVIWVCCCVDWMRSGGLVALEFFWCSCWWFFLKFAVCRRDANGVCV